MPPHSASRAQPSALRLHAPGDITAAIARDHAPTPITEYGATVFAAPRSVGQPHRLG